MEFAQQNAAAVSSHATLQVLAQEAQSRLEAEPYIQGFLDSAQQALAGGEVEDAQGHLVKARALDPKHPGLLELDKQIGAQASAQNEGDTFSLDLEEPVTSFTLAAETAKPAETEDASKPAETAAESLEEPDPLSSFAMLDTAGTEPHQAEPASLEEDDPFAVLSEPAPPSDGSIDADILEAEDDPLAAFAVPVEEAKLDEEVADDPFAALAGAFDEEPRAEASADADEIDDDPFAVFSQDETPTLDTAGSGDDGHSGDARVTDLLEEGQAAFDRRDHQGAIDAWSRIFLIDLDNAEASRRIEAARQLKAESERQVEEIYHEGLAAWKGGSLDEAKQAFEKVVDLEPGHVRAQEHLERLAAGEGLEATQVQPESIAEDDDTSLPPDPKLLDEILIPPDPDEAMPSGEGARRPVESPVRAARGSRLSRKFVLIALGVLLAVGVGGGYLFSNRDAFFPNTASAPPLNSEGAAVATSLDRAKKLHEGGKTKLAIAQLKRLPENHPSYEEAQKLLAEWSAALEPSGQETPAIDQELVDRRALLVIEAQSLEAEGEFLRVQEVLAAVAEISPLDGEELALLKEAEERLVPLQGELDALAERDWNFALKSLWRKHTADPSNRDVVRLLVSCYYNMSVRDLPRGDQERAIQNLDEALALAPDDDEAIRHRRFAQAYTGRPTDLLYRTYVKYLPYR